MAIAGRPISVDGGGLGAGTLLFRRMTGYEELGRPFAYELELLSGDESLALANIVGKSLAVHLELPDRSGERHFHGLVTRFAQLGWSERRTVYGATLRPSLWLLTRRAGCRIFQNKKVPEILKTVLGEYGFPFEESLAGSYPPREYVVQYRESDFDFVSRLMEQEGIYYFFKHERDKHTVVLADGPEAHHPLKGYDEIPFHAPEMGEQRVRDHLDHWQPFHQLEPTAFALRDYDFTRPRANMEVKRAGGGKGSPELEIYDYPGGYVQSSEGERYARTRLEESASRQERAEGAGNARGLVTGNRFKLTEYPRQDQNREYLVVSAGYDLADSAQESASSPSGEPAFRCRITAQASRTPFRPERSTRRPVVQGPQTARVVGKSGEEIWTDQYGRVKVEFHWDRASPGNEDSSCWVRVAQGWSGAAWGAMHVPRMGQEVVVEFLDGDPDRPLVTGHLHDADHMPPYPLPANQTRSGVKSRTTKQGGPDNANEIRFEDRKGEEQLYLQAEKNYDLLVKNDATNTVEHDEKHEVKNDETHTVGHDETHTVKNNRHLSVENDDTIDVKANRSETVGGNESVTISGNRTESVAKNESVTVEGTRTLEVKKSETIDVGQERTETIGKDATLTIEGSQTVTVSKDAMVAISGKRSTTVSKSDTLTVEKALLVSAADQIVLESGSAKIVLKKNGDITIEGKNITLKGSGKINVNASGDVVIKGSSVKTN